MFGFGCPMCCCGRGYNDGFGSSLIWIIIVIFILFFIFSDNGHRRGTF